MSFLNQDTENLILRELFNLNHKVDKYQESNQRQFEELRGEIKTIKETMVTKEDIKKFATKEELKRELNDVSQIFQDTFSELQRREDNLRLELFEKGN